MKRWRADPTEENFWGVVLAYAGVKFKTYTGLPFSYEIKKGRNGQYTKELWIDRRENSKSLAWSSVLLALKNIAVADAPDISSNGCRNSGENAGITGQSNVRSAAVCVAV